MNNSRFRRDVSYGWLIIAVIFLACFLPIKIKAETESNHAPIINSQPQLVVTTDQEYQYEINATDRDGDEINYDLTLAPTGMKLSGNIITWSANKTKTGTYNVAIEASDHNDGYDTQAWQISVEAGAVASLIITPNDRPTIVNLGDIRRFSATANDQYDNIVTGVQINWTTDEEFSSIDQAGMLTAKKGGITFAAAEAGSVKASVGIVVKDIRSTLVTEKNADEEPVIGTTEETTDETTEETTTTEEAVAEEAPVEEMVLGEETVVETEESATTEEEEEPCANMAHWLTFFILAVYALLLILFYYYEKKHRSVSWWIFPFLLTFIGLIIYYKNFCSQTYLWWPWVLVGLGIVITLYYKGRRKRTTDDSQTELPF